MSRAAYKLMLSVSHVTRNSYIGIGILQPFERQKWIANVCIYSYIVNVWHFLLLRSFRLCHPMCNLMCCSETFYIFSCYSTQNVFVYVSPHLFSLQKIKWKMLLCQSYRGPINLELFHMRAHSDIKCAKTLYRTWSPNPNGITSVSRYFNFIAHFVIQLRSQ